MASSGFGQPADQTTSLRLTAGRSATVSQQVSAPMVSITSVRTEPPLDFPPLVSLSPEGGTGLIVVARPATSAGTYRVIINGNDKTGAPRSLSLKLTVDAVTIPKSPTGKTPVILLNGFQLICSTMDSSLAASTGTFGQLATLLQADEIPVAFFNNCAYGGVSIEQLAMQLAIYIAGLTYTDGTAVPQVDLVAHSMGGLISRAYLAGLQSNQTFAPPINPPVQKLILIATPNFGSFEAINIGNQAPEMIPGSSFLWNLATWNQRGDDLRGVDALAVIGDGGNHNSPGGKDDGVVSLTSGSLGFARNDRTRIVQYCHVTPTPVTELGMACSGYQGIADIDSPSHLTAQIVRSFLAGATDWTTIGHSPSQDQWLSQFGGVYYTQQTPQAQPVSDLSLVLFGSTTLTNGAASGTVFYDEFLNGTANFVGTSPSAGPVACGPFTEPAGYYTAFRCKVGPVVSSVGPLVSNTNAREVQSGASITISGSGFGQQCNTCGVFAGSTKLAVSTWADQSITAALPASFSGFIQIQVQAAAGSDSISAMAVSPNPITVSSVANGASAAVGPISPGEIVAIKGTGLGPSSGVSFTIDPATGLVGSNLGGTQVFFGNYAAPITYSSATQVNVVVPYEIAGQSQVSMQVKFGGNSSDPFPLQVAGAAPGVFTFNATGTGQAIAANLTGGLNGPANPAPKGTYVTVYFTGGGITVPPGTTGSVNGSMLKWLMQDISVSVGNQPATVQFDGAAPALIDGVNQLNILLAPDTPSGSMQPLVITVGGISSAATATLAVQ